MILGFTSPLNKIISPVHAIHSAERSMNLDDWQERGELNLLQGHVSEFAMWAKKFKTKKPCNYPQRFQHLNKQTETYICLKQGQQKYIRAMLDGKIKQ